MAEPSRIPRIIISPRARILIRRVASHRVRYYFNVLSNFSRSEIKSEGGHKSGGRAEKRLARVRLKGRTEANIVDAFGGEEK